jgi:hypothetical protein
MRTHMIMNKRSLLALTLLGTAVVAGWSAGRKHSRAKEKVRSAAAIDRWEDEGGSTSKPGNASGDRH